MLLLQSSCVALDLSKMPTALGEGVERQGEENGCVFRATIPLTTRAFVTNHISDRALTVSPQGDTPLRYYST